MSLLLAFRTTPDTIPAQIPYLSADPALIAKWATRMGGSERPRIGLVWGGRRHAPLNYPRDIPLETLRPLLTVDAEFISLQKELSESDRAVLAQCPQIRPFGEELEDFADTAALIANLTLVITVDTAVAHLAGALGTTVWLMNRYAPCWRWQSQDGKSPWYPTLREFRQGAVGDWASVVTAVTTAAREFVRSPSILNRPKVPATLSGSSSRPAKCVIREAVRFVCATRLSRDDFFARAPLGRSLPLYRSYPRGQAIEVRLFPNNRRGLSGLYNTAIEEAKSNPAILIFIHDDVYLSDYYWAEHLYEALESFDVVGLAGNRRRVPRQASWMYLDDQFTCDNYDNLSGVLGHGDPFPNLRQLSVYGEPGQEVKLLDGVMMAARSRSLIDRDLRFDPQFKFHFYDLDFCRQAELRGLRMGTWAIALVHASAGKLGGESWRVAYRQYLAKYEE